MTKARLFSQRRDAEEKKGRREKAEERTGTAAESLFPSLRPSSASLRLCVEKDARQLSFGLRPSLGLGHSDFAIPSFAILPRQHSAFDYKQRVKRLALVLPLLVAASLRAQTMTSADVATVIAQAATRASQGAA